MIIWHIMVGKFSFVNNQYRRDQYNTDNIHQEIILLFWWKESESTHDEIKYL